MSEKQGTQEPSKQEENVWEKGVTQPINQQAANSKTSRKGKGNDKKQAGLLTRIETAKSDIQTSKVKEAIAFADVASDDFIDLTDKFTALRIVEKTAGSIQRAGSMATNFLRSTPATGTYLEDALTSTIEMEDPFLALLTGS